MLSYLSNQYFKSKNKDLKTYYFNLYIKEYFKAVKTDDTDLLSKYFNSKRNDYDLKVERVIYDFETMHFNQMLNIK
jgi:hypothetical protein